MGGIKKFTKMVVLLFAPCYTNVGGDNVTIGERIKAAREKTGMTQVELGEKVGVSGVAIMRYEKGQRQPRYDQLQRIANALGVSVYELFDGSTTDADGTLHIWPAQPEPGAQIPGGDEFDYLIARWRLAEKMTAPEKDEGFDDDSSEPRWPAPQNASDGATPDELEALMAKLQDGKPVLLSPDELAKLKGTPKEQIAAALDKLPSSVPAAHGTGNAFYCRPSLHPELDALFQKSQEGTITADEQERINVLMAIVQNLEGYDPSQHEFFENLRNYRDAVGLSRNKLENKTGVLAARIKDYEDRSNAVFVTDADLQKFAHFFGVDPIKFKGRSVTQEWMTDTHSQNCLRRVNAAWQKLNVLGRDKLAERAEELVEIPRYQAQNAPESTPALQEGTDTTPAETPPDGLQEPPESRITSIAMICPICGKRLQGDAKTGKAYCRGCNCSFPLPVSRLRNK